MESDEPRSAPTTPAAANLTRDVSLWLERFRASEQRPRHVGFRLAFGVLFPSPVAPVMPWILLLVWGLPSLVTVLIGFRASALLVWGPMAFAGYGTFTILIEGSDIARGWRALRALRWGEVARATWQRSEPSGIEVNDTEVLKHTFQFVTPDGQPFTVTAQHLDDSRLRDEPEELVLYDPANPADAVLLGAIPGDPRPTEHGTIEATTEGVTDGALLAAALALTTWICALGGSLWLLINGSWL